MKRSYLFILVISFYGCSNSTKFDKDFNEHKFDTSIINKLKTYDSLRQLVIENIDKFHLNDSSNRFTYHYNFGSTSKISGYENTGVPKEIYIKTVEIFNQLGKTNIYGFTISKDSTFEVLIRNTYSTKYYLDIRERLYWFSNSNRIEKQAFPIKDTLLTDKWQYQIWYDKRANFLF